MVVPDEFLPENFNLFTQNIIPAPAGAKNPRILKGKFAAHIPF
jgi:hypothetical protein